MSMEEKSIALIELMQIVGLFDWYYEMSDDHSVWNRGRSERSRVTGFIYALCPEDLADFEKWWSGVIGEDPIGAKKWVQHAIDEAKRRHTTGGV